MSQFINMLEKDALQARATKRTDDVRGTYYRDTTAIIHSSPFRRLKHKTQVFFAPSNDHICTRIEHVLHVASIATAICNGLGLDSSLAWAIGMGHDLGHAPFGHTGESIISALRTERGLSKFEHEVNSLRVVDFLANDGAGLNLTYAVRDGIVSHCGESFNRAMTPVFKIKNLDRITTRTGLVPATWEGVVVRFSDSIAYLGRDWEDACRLGIVKESDLPESIRRVLGAKNGEIINTLVNSVIDNSSPEKGITFSDNVFEAVEAMISFNYSNIYKSDFLKGYYDYFRRLIRMIYDYLCELFVKSGFDKASYAKENNMLAIGFGKYACEMAGPLLKHDGGYENLIFDYISGMSDNFCIDCANAILKPEHLNEDLYSSVLRRYFDSVEVDKEIPKPVKELTLF